MTRGVTDGSTDGELLERDMSTLFVFTPDGRMLHQRDPHRSPAPRFASAGVRMETLPACATTSARTSRGAARTGCGRGAAHRFRGLAMHRAAYVELLAPERPVARQTLGVSYVAPDQLRVRRGCARTDGARPRHEDRLRSGTEEGARLVARLDAEGMPSELVELGYSALWAPWCVACSGDEIVAVTDRASRSTPVSRPACSSTSRPVTVGTHRP